jgi:hypothetical protein
MEKITYTVAQDLVAPLEAAGYELEARKEIIKEMLALDMDTETEAFSRYQRELVEYKTKFELLKAEFETNVVKALWPNAVRWNLQYSSCELVVELDGTEG